MNFSPAKSILLLTTLLLTACQHPIKPAGPISSDQDLRDTLAAMARAHDQKTQLAFYESLPWQRTAEPFHTFFVTMGKTQRELYDQLQAWAKTADHGNPMPLTYTRSDDTPGRAQKIVEARQEKLIRGDSKIDFTRDSLMQMYEDYEWQISLIQALQPRVSDPVLKAYLEKSLKVHQEGSDELMSLLKRFKP